MKFVPNVHGYISHLPELKPIDTVPAHVSPRPVPSGQFDSPASAIDYLDAFGGEGEFDIFYVEERSFREEVEEILIMS